MYKCEMCGREYPTIQERSKCEASCVNAARISAEERAKKAREKAERDRKDKLEKEKDSRSKEVLEAYRKYIELLRNYNKDYREDYTFSLSKLFDIFDF